MKGKVNKLPVDGSRMEPKSVVRPTVRLPSSELLMQKNIRHRTIYHGRSINHFPNREQRGE